MATTTHLVTWEEFEQLPDDGTKHEIIEGRLLRLPPAKLGHSKVAKRVLRALLSAEDIGPGEAYPEAGYRLSVNPSTWIQPDVSFVTQEHVIATDDGKYLTGAPELAVEVVSPSETAAELDKKVHALLAAGGIEVWVVYPETQRVRVFRRDGTSFTRGISDSLSLPELLPGWELPVAKLFED
jgi:Uma2 family endonuclease